MSDWQLNQDRGIKTEIAMPPLTHEQQAETASTTPVNTEQAPNFGQINHLPAETQVEQSELVEEVRVEAEPEPETNSQRKVRLNEEANFREYRSEYKRLKEENERLHRENQQRSTQPQNNHDDNDDDVRPDDIVEGKHLKRMTQKLKQLESKLEMSNIEIRLKSQFPDFDKVVTKDSLDQLKDQHPEIYQTIYSSTDVYNKAASAYTIMKKLGIGQPDTHERDRQVAQKNAAKPRPVTSISPQTGNTPLSQANAFANGLTKELQAQLMKEMSEARKGY